MHPDRPPPNARDFEHWLAGRAFPEPSADLRDRLVTGMSKARYPAIVDATRNRDGRAWQFAAAALIFLNVAMGIDNGFRYRSLETFSGNRESRARAGPAFESFEPDDEIPGLAASALARLTLAPDAGYLSRHFFEQKEN